MGLAPRLSRKGRAVVRIISVLMALAASVASAEVRRVQSPTRLVRVAVEASEGSTIEWEAADPLTLDFFSCETTQGKSVCVFYLGGEQAVVKSDRIDWERREREKITWVVTLSGDVPPGPGPEPGPPELGMEAVARSALASVSEYRELKSGLAESFAAVASAVAAGGIATEVEARTEVQRRNRALLGPETDAKHQAWRGWLLAVGDALAEKRQQGRLSTVKSYGRALAEIAKGLQ